MSILGERYFKTSNAVYCYGLSCRELAVYGYLRSRAGSKETCWPSMQTIAAACGCSDTTARKAVDELERWKFIRRVPTYATDRKGRRRQCNNTYYLLDLPPLPGPKDKLTYHEEAPETGTDGRTKEKQDKHRASQVTPAEPQTPAVRAFSRAANGVKTEGKVRRWGQESPNGAKS